MTPALQAAVAAGVTTLALNWKLTRGDGMVLGFTSHDRDLRLGGLSYRARPGMTPSAVSLSAGFAPDSMEVEGVLDAAGLRAADLDAGRWTGARLELFVCDWAAPAAGQHRLMRGSIGDVVREAGAGARGRFRLELVSEVAALELAGAPLCSPLCRATLGDARCGVDMAGRRIDVRCVAAAGDEVALAAPVASADLYVEGRMRVVTGALAGLDRGIAALDGATLLLDAPVWAAGLAGATLWLFEGCDRRLATCAGRFGNALAFDGEPHVPGTDALLRYGES
jgi:uncharacterized phage protein (TIGR02218 family)